MTREKEILNAATEARMASAETLTTRGTHHSIDDIPFIDEMITYDEVAENAFIKGAEWADSHPVNVWHDANTMPSDSKSIIYLTKNGKFGVISQVHSNKWDWYVAVKYSIIKWAYVDDLLPKGGDK